MLRVLLLGGNGLPIQINDDGSIESVDTGQYVSESDFFDGRFDNVLLMGMYGNELLPVLINHNGEII